MIKQRRDSITQFEAAARQELADIEKFEISILQIYMPQPMTEAEVEVAVNDAIASSGVPGCPRNGQGDCVAQDEIGGSSRYEQSFNAGEGAFISKHLN